MNTIDRKKFINSNDMFRIYAIGNYNVQGITLGKGNFAKVKLATHKVVGIAVALKIININEVKESYVIRNLEREVQVLARLNHPNIVKFYEAIWCNKLYCISMEYIRGGDLSDHIKAHPNCKIMEMEAKHLFRQILSAVGHMHRRGILHRDLKLENIMMEDPTTIKIVDFGLSNYYDGKHILRTRCGSPEYAAPELFIPNIEYGPAIDMWSLGIILYVMVIGYVPFVYSNQVSKTVQGRRRYLYKRSSKGLVGVHIKAMEMLSQGCRDLIHGLVQPNQELRYKLEVVESHSWLLTNAGRPFQTQQPNPSLYRQFHSEAIQRISILTSMSECAIERKVQTACYDKVHAMYRLLVDSIVKRERHASTVPSDRMLSWNSYVYPYMPYYQPRVIHSRQQTRDEKQKQTVRAFINQSQNNTRIQETSKLFPVKFPKENRTPNAKAVRVQNMGQVNSETLKLAHISQYEQNTKLKSVIDKDSGRSLNSIFAGLIVNKLNDDGCSVQSILLKKDNCSENEETTYVTINTKSENSKLNLSSINAAAGDGGNRSQEAKTRKVQNTKERKYQSSCSNDKEEIKKVNVALQNILRFKTQAQDSNFKTHSTVGLSNKAHIQNQSAKSNLKQVNCSKQLPPATAIGIRDSGKIKAAPANIQVVPKTSHGIVRTKEEKCATKDFKGQPSIAILKRPTQPILLKAAKSTNNSKSSIPSSSLNKIRNIYLPKSQTVVKHGSVATQTQTDAVLNNKLYHGIRGQIQSKYKPSALCDNQYNNKTIQERLGREITRDPKETIKSKIGLQHFCHDNFSHDSNKSKWQKQPLLPPLFKKEASRNEDNGNIFESSKQRFSQSRLGQLTSHKNFFLSPAPGRTSQIMYNIPPARRPHSRLYDKTENCAYVTGRNRKLHYCSPSVVDRTIQSTRSTHTVNTDSPFKFSYTRNTADYTRNNPPISNQAFAAMKTKNFQLNKLTIGRASKYQQLVGKSPSISPQFVKTPAYQRTPKIINNVNPNAKDVLYIRKDCNLGNVFSKIDSGLTNIKTPSRRYSQIRAQYKLKKNGPDH